MIKNLSPGGLKTRDLSLINSKTWAFETVFKGPAPAAHLADHPGRIQPIGLLICQDV